MADENSGKTIVLIIVLVTIAVSAVVIALYVVAHGISALPQRAVRFTLTVALGWFLYRGAAWARWTAVVLFTLGGLGSLAAGSQLVARGYPANGAPLLLMGTVYVASALALLFIRSVRAHFARGAAA